MSWNYRVIREVISERPVNEGKVDWFSIHEVYYKDKDGGEDYNNISGWTADAVDIAGESMMEIQETLNMIIACLSKPVLDYTELERVCESNKNH